MPKGGHLTPLATSTPRQTTEPKATSTPRQRTTPMQVSPQACSFLSPHQRMSSPSTDHASTHAHVSSPTPPLQASWTEDVLTQAQTEVPVSPLATPKKLKKGEYNFLAKMRKHLTVKKIQITQDICKICPQLGNVQLSKQETSPGERRIVFPQASLQCNQATPCVPKLVSSIQEKKTNLPIKETKRNSTQRLLQMPKKRKDALPAEHQKKVSLFFLREDIS